MRGKKRGPGRRAFMHRRLRWLAIVSYRHLPRRVATLSGPCGPDRGRAEELQAPALRTVSGPSTRHFTR
jgi:hypothetical protein